jgi:hypothetical protein
MLWDQFYVIRLSVVYRGRAIPILWRVLKHGSSRVKFSIYQDLLDKAAYLLPSGVKVVFLADRGFGCHRLLRYVRKQLHWHRIRLTVSSWGWRTGKGWQQLSQFHLHRG